SGASLRLWIRRGSNAFSERPEAGEDFQLGFIGDNGAFQQLGYLPGAGTAGEVFDYDIELPASALLAAFQVRLAVIACSGGQNDYWHVDDVCVVVERVAHHLAWSHDGNGVNCQAEPVELIVHDAEHFVVENFQGAVTLASSTGHGEWSVLAGNGSL